MGLQHSIKFPSFQKNPKRQNTSGGHCLCLAGRCSARASRWVCLDPRSEPPHVRMIFPMNASLSLSVSMPSCLPAFLLPPLLPSSARPTTYLPFFSCRTQPASFSVPPVNAQSDAAFASPPHVFDSVVCPAARSLHSIQVSQKPREGFPKVKGCGALEWRC